MEPAKAAPPVQDRSAPAKTEAPEVKGAPQPGKDEKQTTIPGMGEPTPAGKVVDFTAARDGATKGKPPEKAVAQDKDKQADKAKDAAKPRRGRPPRLIRRPPTSPSRNLGTKCPKANRLSGKVLPSKQRPRPQPSSRPPLGMPPVA